MAKQRTIDEPKADHRIQWLKWMLCAAIVSQIAVTPRLWETTRTFPTVPALTFLPELPQTACLALTVAFVLSVFAFATLARSKWPGWTALGLGCTLVLFDINRLQPWFYQYLLMLWALSRGEKKSSESALPICGFILASIYVWSGIHKLNLMFATEALPFLLRPLGQGVVSLAHPAWFLVPITESAIGFLLLIGPMRKVGLTLAVSMHVLLLYLLGPLGLNYNSSIWPWNFWMIAFCLVLFWKPSPSLLKPVFQDHLGKAIFLLCGVLPALHFFGLWDTYLSASLYSEKALEGWIYLTETGYAHLPSDYKVNAIRSAPGQYRIGILEWGSRQLNVPPYPEARVFRAVAERLVQEGVPAGDITLLVRNLPTLSETERTFSNEPIR